MPCSNAARGSWALGCCWWPMQKPSLGRNSITNWGECKLPEGLDFICFIHKIYLQHLEHLVSNFHSINICWMHAWIGGNDIHSTQQIFIHFPEFFCFYVMQEFHALHSMDYRNPQMSEIKYSWAWSQAKTNLPLRRGVTWCCHLQTRILQLWEPRDKSMQTLWKP